MVPWTVAHQVLLSVELSRQKYCSGLPCPPPGGYLYVFIECTLVPLVQNASQRRLSLLPLNILSCLVKHSGTENRIEYNFFQLINMFYSWLVCFHNGLKPSFKNRLLSLLWLSPFGKGVPLWGTPLKVHNDWGTHFGCQLFWLVWQHFHCTSHPQFSGIGKSSNDSH